VRWGFCHFTHQTRGWRCWTNLDETGGKFGNGFEKRCLMSFSLILDACTCRECCSGLDWGEVRAYKVFSPHLWASLEWLTMMSECGLQLGFRQERSDNGAQNRTTLTVEDFFILVSYFISLWTISHDVAVIGKVGVQRNNGLYLVGWCCFECYDYGVSTLFASCSDHRTTLEQSSCSG
jgi:hypothetical protein